MFWINDGTLGLISLGITEINCEPITLLFFRVFYCCELNRIVINHATDVFLTSNQRNRNVVKILLSSGVILLLDSYGSKTIVR
jgi:hypothetical protein